MRDDICTIPISEVFETVCGCPVCRMHDTVQGRILDYTMGSAKMEPDVRIETNRLGFCANHLDMMLHRSGRLGLALLLESHLGEILNTQLSKNGIFDKSPEKKAAEVDVLTKSCFICDKINWGMERMVDMIFRLYESESDFRRLFDAQEEFCLPHYSLLMNGANKKLMPTQYKDFSKVLVGITTEHLKVLSENLHKYCGLYDYRSAGQDPKESEEYRDATEKAVEFLS